MKNDSFCLWIAVLLIESFSSLQLRPNITLLLGPSYLIAFFSLSKFKIPTHIFGVTYEHLFSQKGPYLFEKRPGHATRL